MTREEAIKIIGCYDIGFYDLSGEKIPAEKLVEAFEMAREALQDRPTVDSVEVVRCKNCKHFTLNLVENVDGVPLIVAHEICSFWGDGCKTSQEGFCSYGERREE